MAEKNISINELAEMIKKGFDNTATKEQFDGLEGDVKNIKEKLGRVENKLSSVETRLTSVETKLDKVDDRLKKVETVLTDAHVL